MCSITIFVCFSPCDWRLGCWVWLDTFGLLASIVMYYGHRYECNEDDALRVQVL